MADGVFNISKGRVVEFYLRVDGNDPAASELNIRLLDAAEADGTLVDYDDFAALLVPAGNVECGFTNYATKVLTDTETTAEAPDDTADDFELVIPNQTWTAAGNGTNDTIVKLIVSYDSLGTDADATVIPMTHHDFVVTTDGNDLIAQFDQTNGFFRAS